MKKLYLLVLGFISVIQILEAENTPNSNVENCDESTNYLYWVGGEDQDFWNEANWRITNQKPSNSNSDADGSDMFYCLPGANKEPFQICLGNHDPENDRVPSEGTLDPDSAIKYNLYIQNASIAISEDLSFSCANKGITSLNSEITFNNQFLNGVLSLDKETTIYFVEEQQSHENVKYNLLDPYSWVYFYQNNPNEILNSAGESLYILNTPAEIDRVRIDQYYQKGSIYRQESAEYKPLKIYSNNSNSGDSAELSYYDIFRRTAIPEGLNNSISSFKLKRGFQATFAVEENGTSMSKVYIASEKDLIIDDLPEALKNNISFIRVMPWEWIVKKGTGGYYNGLDAGWYYNWGNGSDSEPNYHYEPMTWGAGPTRPDGINRIIEKKDVNHLLGFNESDNCEDQSGQFNNLCEPAVAVAYYENIMGTGLRLGTPAPRENGPFGWLDEFAQIAKERNVRFDFVAVHWYDWGSNPANSPNAPASEIFNRFKTYLENVHAKYNLPIWITEFNANPNRGNATQEAFLRLALPYLESLEYIERYAYFEPNPNNSTNPNEPAYYYDEAGNLTNIGRLYLEHESTPSIPETTYKAPNNLEGLDQPFEEKEPYVVAFEAECSPFLGSQTDLIEDELASNNYYLQFDPDKKGAKDLARQVHFEFNLNQGDSYRLWVRYKSATGSNTAIRAYVDDTEEYEELGGLSSSNFRWEQLPRFFDLDEGSHRITIELLNDRFLFDAVALISNSGSVDLIPRAAETCTLSEERWGANETDITYFQEAEAAEPLGSSWQIGSNENAIGGEFIESKLNSSGTPPADSGYAVFNFEVDESDEYEIWGKIQALTADSDALWIKIDDGDFILWDHLKNEEFIWYWNKVYSSYSDEERKKTYFLDAGMHTITIAHNEANIKIDRVAISSIGRSPAFEDPNVLMGDNELTFEAEEAILIGNNAVADCAQASNGQQVRPANAATNRIRFEGIAFSQPGTRTLQVTYMSANSRLFGLVVNGERLANQTVESSGSWCFAGGQTAVYEVDVAVKAGENVVEITGAFDNAPFIDKIGFKSGPLYSMEAELAVLNGNATIQTCTNASNGEYVNTFEFSGNSIEFQNISVAESGSFELSIDYISKNNRQMNLLVDGESQGILEFVSSGEWCFNGGTPATFSRTINLEAGTHTITLQNAGVRAPLIDKISLSESVLEDKASIQIKAGSDLNGITVAEDELKIAPNPVYSGETIGILIPDDFDSNIKLEIFDISGKLIFSETFQRESNTLFVNPKLTNGQYLISLVEPDGRRTSKHLIVR